MKILVHFGNEIREYEITDNESRLYQGIIKLGNITYKESGLADGLPIYRVVR